MTKKVLLTYASRAGSTAEVAGRIGSILKGLSFDVDVKSVKEVTDITMYDSIVIGSAVRMFKLLPETVKFANRLRDELKNKPVAYFIVCLTMYENNKESRAKAQEYLKPLLKIKQPISIGLFGGKMDYSKLSFIWRILFKGRIPEGDFRNWNLIEEWAKNLGEELKNKV
jgi:menaquinone-dependent protoporphyrinogen oxidase